MLLALLSVTTIHIRALLIKLKLEMCLLFTLKYLLKQSNLLWLKLKAIVSVVGMDKPGIVAGVSTTLSKHMVNIRDISQSFAHEFFTMIMVVDFENSDSSLKEVSDDLKKVGEEIGIFVSIQHEDVFRRMHRI